MIDLDLNGEEPKHVERLTPIISTDITGKVSWTPSLLDYDASKFYRGKQISNEEFNELFLKQLYQGNYIVDTLTEFFDNQLGAAILNHFKSGYDLTQNYIKILLSTDWGTPDENGYYNVVIPADEHGFHIDTEEDVLERMNIRVTVYLYKNDTFYEVPQFQVDSNNTVTVYTDDNTVSGFVVIQDNNKAFSFTEGTITIGQVTGLDNVLKNLETRIGTSETNISALRNGTIYAGKARIADEASHADDADNTKNLTTTINNMPITNIFENEATSRDVKQATRASRLSTLKMKDSLEDYVEAGSVTQPVYFEKGLPVAITGALANDITGRAAVATKADFTDLADKALKADTITIDRLTATDGSLPLKSIINVETLLDLFKTESMHTKVTRYISKSSSRNLSDIINNAASWEPIGSSNGWTFHTQLGPYCNIYAGLIINPSGKTNDYWYRIDLPDSEIYSYRLVLASPVYNEVGGGGSVLCTYTPGGTRSVYIARDDFSYGDRPNVSYLIITFKW